ncbi:hypothetical protein D9M73_181670 [compost metagenome]
MVAPTLAEASRTNCAASLVVMCSNTTLRVGKRSTTRRRFSSMKRFSRSNTSMSAWVTSPCTSSGRPTSAMASSTGKMLSMLVTPESELVVAPAGYSLAAWTKPLALAARTSSAVVRSVR